MSKVSAKKEKPAQELRKTKRKLATAEKRLGRVAQTRRSKSRQRSGKGVVRALERIADNFFEGAD